MSVSAEEAYYVVLRTVVAGKQANWTVMGHMAQLRQLMGVSDDLHKQYLEQINADPEVCAINGNPPPAPKRQRTTPTPTAGAGGVSRQQSKPRPRPGRSSDPGYLAPPPPPLPPPPTYGQPNRMAPEHDPHGLVGCRVNIIQEDDTTVEGMVVDFIADDATHVVVVPPDETGEPLPLLEFPESYENLGPHPDYVHPHPPLSAAPLSMPPPASRPRTNSFSGLPPGSASAPPRAPKSRKAPTVRGAGTGGGGSSSSGASRLGPPPYNPGALDARLAVADLPELSNMLAAISRKERGIMAELEAAGLLDDALSRSVMERETLVGQVCAH